MSLQNLMHRRRFMERSLLGAGGLLFTSAVLESCTLKDHVIPNPNGPVLIPHLGDYEVDWNDAAKTAVTTGISMLVPEGGEILSALVDVFWPSNPQENVWDQVKEQVEAVVGKAVKDQEYRDVSNDLAGLQGLMAKYLNELRNGTNDEKLQRWGDVDTAFTLALPHFQSSGSELPLLGLFGQFANMYLSVLRDVVISGKEWGRTDSDHQQDIADLKKYIQDFTSYVTKTYDDGRAALQSSTKFDMKKTEPFRTVNAYDRQMTLMVLDFRDTWYAFDVVEYPSGANIKLTREIFTDPMGQGVNPDIPFRITTPAPKQLPTTIDAWSGKFMNAIQLTYPQGGGPGGVTQTPKYGSHEAATTHRTYNIGANNPIVKVDVTFGEWVNTILFYYADGTQSDTLGSDRGGSFNFWAPTNEVLSSIMIQESVGPSKGNAAAVVAFGFQYWQSPSATLVAIGNMYVKSPKERSEADLHKAFPRLGISAGSITSELKAAREAYWASIEERANG